MSEEERKRRKREEERKKELQKLRQLQKRRSLHDKHKRRRKKDCMIGLPFIVAFQGDPAQLFYCNDIPRTFELIPRTSNYPRHMYSLARLKQYMKHHVVHIAKKVLIYKAGRQDWRSRFSLKNSFRIAWILWGIIFNVAFWKSIEMVLRGNLLGFFVFQLALVATVICAFLLRTCWKFYTE